MRSVETKAPMVRVANTGISAVIQSDGTITARTPILKRTTETEHVYWRQERTVYVQVGDIFAETCLALTLIGLGIALVRPRPGAGEPQEDLSAIMSVNSHRR